MKIAILGAAGRMGRMLLRAVMATEGAELVGATTRADSEHVGTDAGALIGAGDIGVRVEVDPLPIFTRSDAVIDFTVPSAVVAHSALSAQARIVHVIGATGFNESHLSAIDAASHHAPVIRAGNMSLGVNLLTVLTEKVARALDEDFDIEVVEMHHNQKVDAPSGTALMLGEAAAKGRNTTLTQSSDRGRDGITGKREKGRIGFAALRGGDVVGEHDVIFAAAGERIVLRHMATDRAIFARGAVKAALWGYGRPPGAYDMIDVLGLR